jgi:GT2 family glycosyltransferase
MEFMDKHPTAGITGPRILNPDRTLQPQCQHFPSIWNHLCQILGLNKLFPKSSFFSEPFMKYWPHDQVRKVDAISGCFWIVRREAIDQVGLLDEDFFFYGEDIDWCKRFHQAGWDVMFYPKVEVIHHGSASASKAPIKFYIELQKADLHYWGKHHGRIGKVSYLALIILRNLLRLIFGAIQYVVNPSQKETIAFKLERNFACIRWALHI